MDKKLENTKATFTLNGVIYTETKTGYCFKSTGMMDKKGQPINRRIAKATFEKAWEEFLQTKEDEEIVVVEPETIETEEPKTEEEIKLEPAVLNENGLVDCSKCPNRGNCIHHDAMRRNPKDVGGLGLCPRLNVKAEEPKKEEKPKTKKVSKPRRSKDVAFEMDTIRGHITLTAKQVDFIKHLPDTCFWENGLESSVWCDCLADEIGGQFAEKPMTVGAMISTLREKGLVAVGRDDSRTGKPKFMEFTEVGKVIAKKLGLE